MSARPTSPTHAHGGPSKDSSRETSRPAAMPSVDDVVRSAGKPLDGPMRRRMEERFSHSFSAIRVHGAENAASRTSPGESEADRVAKDTERSAPQATSSIGTAHAVDFSHVRLHTGPDAAASAQLIGAQAYTAGSHVVIDENQSPTQSAEGRQTLAHELTHVVQRVGPRPSYGPAGAPVSPAGPVARKEAYPKLHEDVLKELIAIARKHKTDGEERIPELTTLAKTVPEKDRAPLVDRLEKPPRKDAFTDYVRNMFPTTREAFLAALGASPKTPAAAASKGSTPSKGFSALNNARSKPEYIDNGIVRLRTDGETAEIVYRDGSTLTLGLVPENVKAPFEGVDYRSARSQQATLDPTEPGTLRFVPHFQQLGAPGMSAGDFMAAMEKRARTVRFVVEPNSKRLVPTEVNVITAPLLCKTLLKADEENEALAKATSEGGVKVFEAFGIILEIAGFMVNPAERAGAVAAEKLTPEAAGMLAVFRSMRSKLAQVLGVALKEGAVIPEVFVEGVALGTVKPVVEEGATLTVRYAFIKNIGRVAGRGRMAQWALEAAAKDVARAQGLKLARVWVEGPIEAKWLAYLYSIGYSWSAEAFPAGMVKVLSL